MASPSVVYKDGNVTVTISGLNELNDRLDKMRQDLARRLLIDAMKRSLRQMLNTAERMAPVGWNVTRRNNKQGGALYSHRGGNLKRAFRILKPRGTDPFAIEVNMVNMAYYARWVEYGHNIVKGRGSKKRVVGKSPPRPFMRPAFEAHKGQAIETLQKEILAALTRRGV